jgi:hypothetical protein
MGQFVIEIAAPAFRCHGERAGVVCGLCSRARCVWPNDESGIAE